jgi:hypothetical protein
MGFMLYMMIRKLFISVKARAKRVLGHGLGLTKQVMRASAQRMPNILIMKRALTHNSVNPNYCMSIRNCGTNYHVVMM